MDYEMFSLLYALFSFGKIKHKKVNTDSLIQLEQA